MPLLDTNQLNAMATGATEQFIIILDDFLTSSRDSLTRLAALTPAEAPEATSIAHQLKGSSGSLGLQDLHLLLKESETDLKQGTPLSPERVRQLQTLLESSVTTARQHVQSLDTPPDHP